jgi:hypothetical protein
MSEIQNQEIIAMLTVIYRKLDKLENRFEERFRTAPDQTYLEELRKEAGKISDKIKF